MIIAVTGHRPEKLFKSEPYAAASFERLAAFSEAELRRLSPDRVITGMALGWDQAIAAACVSLGLPFVAAIPFPGQAAKWPQASKDIYGELVNAAAQVVMVNYGDYAAWKMHARNQWMVDRCDSVLALHDGTSGGTAGCLRYAKIRRKEIDNAWKRWIAFRNSPQLPA